MILQQRLHHVCVPTAGQNRDLLLQLSKPGLHRSTHGNRVRSAISTQNNPQQRDPCAALFTLSVQVAQLPCRPGIYLLAPRISYKSAVLVASATFVATTAAT